MEKKTNENFRQYAQQWRDMATQVQPPLLKKETNMLFISTLKAPFINHMLGSATKSFSNIVMSREMIENTIRCGKIEAGEGTKRSVPRRRENKVNNMSTYNKGHSRAITVSQPKATTTNHQGPPRQESITRWYDANAQCEYAGITWHSIENCTMFKKVVEKLIKMGIVKFDDPPVPNAAGNPLPNHTDQGANGINEGGGRKVKYDVAEVKTPLRQVWKEMVERGLITLNSKERAIVQNLMDNKEMAFYEEIEGSEEREVAPRVIIQKPVVISYRDSKRVPWNYDCNVTIQGKENPASASKEDQDVGSHTRSGRRYDLVKGKAPIVEQEKEKSIEPESPVNEPMREEEAREFLKFLKHSEYCVVEQLHKQPARISVLALLQSSEVHRNALMKVLNETYVANDISVSKLGRLVNNISADKFIYFNDDEILPGGTDLLRLCILPLDAKEGRLVTINAEEDIIAVVTSDTPYLETNDEAIEVQATRQRRKELKKRQERRKARVSGEEIKWEPMVFPHISKTFISGGIIHPKRKTPREENVEEMMRNVHINAIHEETTGRRNLSGICPFEPGSVLNNWTAEDFEDDMDCGLSPDLLRMVKQEERQILPHEEAVEVVTLEEGKAVKIGTCITEETKRDLVDLLQEFKDVFAWSYQDMSGLSTDIVVHRLPIKEDCKPVQQKL
ncbi:hypothetical protein EPI10_001285 [Gossypium australe]|uniref:Uncharacterized protein n=1 Tax=Gossypium australe TaxID=47621 RepID=A0A5B6VAY8_9ROSI|nr:hypothetical protein EPI10_001285 [Gossypium australe]